MVFQGSGKGLRLTPTRQIFSDVKTLWGVEAEKTCRGSTNWREPADLGTEKFKVLVPSLGSRVVDHFHPARVRISGRHIGPFIPVAVGAGQGQIVQIVAAAMLVSKNMFDVEPDRRDSYLGQTAVLTAFGGSFTNLSPDGCIHWLLLVVDVENGARADLQQGKEIEEGHELLVLSPLVRTQSPFRPPICQLVNAILCLGGCAHSQYFPSCIGS